MGSLISGVINRATPIITHRRGLIISGVISRVTILITHMFGTHEPMLITTHEPPSRERDPLNPNPRSAPSKRSRRLNP